MAQLTPVVAGAQAAPNDVNQIINLLNNKWRCQAQKSASQSLTTAGTFYKLAFDTIPSAPLTGDPSGLLSLGGSRFTVPAGGTGTWRFSVHVPSGFGAMQHQFYRNGLATGPVYQAASGAQVDFVEALMDLTAGDYVEFFMAGPNTPTTLSAGVGVYYWVVEFVGLN